MNRQEKTILTFSSVLLVLALVFLVYLPQAFNSFDSLQSEFAGLVMNAKGDVKIRFGETINWRGLSKQDKIYSNSYLFTGEDSSATFAFVDETSLNLGPNSLVYIGTIESKSTKAKDENLELELVNGEMQVDLKKLSKIQSLKIASADIKLGKESSTIRLVNNPDSMEVSIMKGSVKLSSKDGEYNIKSGEKLEVKSGKESEVSQLSPELLEEIKKISDEDRKMILAEYQKTRNLSSVISFLIERLFN